jgi:phospholipid transport system substrate-binding protein
MNIKFWLKPFLLSTLFCFIFAIPARAGEPFEVVKAGVEKVIQILRDPKYLPKEKKQDRVDRIREVVDPLFDYDEMAKRALGAHWRRRTPAEQEEFVKLFREFLGKTYAEKIELYESEKVSFGRETIDQDFAQVETAIINAKGEQFAVVYRLHRTEGVWKVYDAVVENISVVNNYRSQFDRVISSSSYQELVKRLKAKLG